MKYLSILFIVFFPVTMTQAQSITVSGQTGTNDHGVNEFRVAGHELTIADNSLSHASSSVSADLSDRTAISAVLNNRGIHLHAGNGSSLYTTTYKLMSDDNSVKVYVKPNGGFIVRENIANFLFYNASGQIQQSVSNSSQSTEGEAVSELSADPMFKTVVLYNPTIVRNGREGSQASVVQPNWTKRNIYYSDDRTISGVRVAESGQLIAVITQSPGTDDEVSVTDRFGNKLGTFDFNQEVDDVRFSSDGQFVTIRSGGRVGVYSLTDGNRIGSTSFRSSLHFANYIPEDETVIALTADGSGTVLTDIEVHAINLSARAIERGNYEAALGKTELLPIRLNRTGSRQYELVGLSRTLEVNVRF